jgi:hypothetical protein
MADAFPTTALSILARARRSPAVSAMARSVVFSRTDPRIFQRLWFAGRAFLEDRGSWCGSLNKEVFNRLTYY